MSILNTLANIGISLGKAALSLFTGKKTEYMKDGSRLTLSNLKIGDITFYEKAMGDRRDVYIYNSSIDKSYMVSFTNEDKRNGEVFPINAQESHPVTHWFKTSISPATQIQIAQSGESNDLTASGDNKLNLSFNKLQINGKPIILGGFQISAVDNSSQCGIQVKCKNSMGLQNLEFCMLTNNKGVSMIQNAPIAPNTSSNEEVRFYPLEYSQHGITSNDVMNGVLNIGMTDKRVLLENCKSSFVCPDRDILNRMLQD